VVSTQENRCSYDGHVRVPPLPPNVWPHAVGAHLSTIAATAVGDSPATPCAKTRGAKLTEDPSQYVTVSLCSEYFEHGSAVDFGGSDSGGSCLLGILCIGESGIEDGNPDDVDDISEMSRRAHRGNADEGVVQR